MAYEASFHRESKVDRAVVHNTIRLHCAAIPLRSPDSRGQNCGIYSIMRWAFLFPIGVSPSLLALAVVSLLFHFAIIFTSVTAIILLHGWNQMIQARRQVHLTTHNRRTFLNYGIIPHVSLFSDRLPYFSDQQVLNRRDTNKWTPFCPKRPLLNDFTDKQVWANARNSYAWNASPNSYIRHSITAFPTLAKIT